VDVLAHRASPVRRSRVVRAATRIGWGIADQAVSSLTNFAVGIVVARALDAAGFGVFGLAWVTYGVALNISRGLCSDPFTVRFSAADPADRARAVARMTGCTLLVGAGAGTVTAGIGLAIGGPLGAAFVALGVVLPGVLLQDAWRFAFFAAGAGRRSFANDLAWGAALVPALALASSRPSVFAFVLAWGVSGGVAGLMGCLQAGIRPRPGRAAAWLREQRDLGPRYLIENLSISGATQLRLVGLGAVSGLAAVGAIRGGELLIGPFLALLMGISVIAVPEATRVRRAAPHRLRQFCLLLGAVQALAAAVWGVLLLLLPDPWGRELLGDVWPGAAALIVPMTLTVMGSSMSTGAMTGLRSLGAARRSLRAQLVAAAAYAVFGIAGAWVGGAPGSAWGLAAATSLAAAVWWSQLLAGLHDPGALRLPATGRTA
jgi:O-antigen/teichoic acid export membrane protein